MVAPRGCSAYGLGINFWQLHTTQEVHWYHAWRRSSYEQPGSSLLIEIFHSMYYSCHSNGILERQEGVQLWVCTTYGLGTKFCQLHDSNNTDVILDDSAGLINLDTNTTHVCTECIKHCSCWHVALYTYPGLSNFHAKKIRWCNWCLTSTPGFVCCNPICSRL